MRALVDKVTFDSKPAVGTVVHLEKRLEFAEGSPIQRLTEGQPSTEHGPWSQDEHAEDAPRPGSLPGVTARVGVVTFPGSLDDRDAQRAVRLAGGEPVALWHADADLQGVDAVVAAGRLQLRRLPAGRRHRALRARDDERRRAGRARPAGARHLQRLPGPVRERPAARRADPQRAPALRQPRPAAAHREHRLGLDARLRAGQEVVVPVKNGEGSYVADERDPRRARGRGPRGRALPRQQPQRHARDIAGIRNERGNVVGLMPHPEHAVEELVGPRDRRPGLLHLVLQALVSA